MNYYERHIGDYLKDTAHLSLLEHGVYSRLMDVYYTREGAIPQAEVARLIGARSKDEKAALVAVLEEFFVLVDGSHAQARCDREIIRFQDKQAKAKRSAEARWNAPRTQSVGNANASPSADASDMRTHSEGNAPRARPQTPDTSNHTQEENVANATAEKPAKSKLTDPQEIIFGYGVPLLVNAGSTDKAARSFLGGLRKAHGDAELVNKLRDCIREQPLQPLEWLAKALPPKRAVPPPEAEAARRANVDAEAMRLLGFKSSEVIDG